jgi:hypothetical protein
MQGQADSMVTELPAGRLEALREEHGLNHQKIQGHRH